MSTELLLNYPLVRSGWTRSQEGTTDRH